MATTQKKKMIWTTVFAKPAEQAAPVPVPPQQQQASWWRMIGTQVFGTQQQVPQAPVQQQSAQVTTPPPTNPPVNNTDDLYRDTRQTPPPVVPTPQQQAPQAPVQSTPTKTTTPQPSASTKQQVTPQQQELDYQTANEDRLNQIRDNLNAAAVNNPKSFFDRATFEKSYNYSTRSQEQKDILDAAYETFHKKSSWELLDSIMMWADIPAEQKKWQGYMDATSRKMDLDRYLSMSSEQLANTIDNLPAWSTALDDLRRYAPDKYQAALQMQQKIRKLKMVNSSVVKRLISPPDSSQRLSSQMTKPDDIPDSYEGTNQKTLDELQQDPNLVEAFRFFVSEDKKVLAAQQDIEDKRKAVTQVNMEIANLENRLKTQMFEWDAPASYIAALAAQLSKPLMDKLYFAQDELKAAEDKFSQINSLKIQEFNAYKDQVQMDQQKQMQEDTQAFQVQQADTAYNRQVELAKMGYEQQNQLNQVNFEQQKQYAEYVKQLEEKYPWFTFKVNDDGSVTSINNSNGNVSRSAPPDQADASAIDFIKAKEWFRSQAYQDSAGVWTIWYWFTSVNGKPVKKWDSMSQAEADTVLQEQIKQYQNFDNLVTVPLTNNQRTALTSFEYNLWSGIRTKSKWWAQEIINAVNSGDFAKAGELMLQFNKANVNGKLTVLNGLTNRRKQEAALLLKQDAVASATSPTDTQWLLSLATKLYETGGFEPKDVAALGYTMDEFNRLAPQVYAENKAKEFGANWFTVTNPDLLFGKSKKAMEDIAGTVPVAHTLIKKMQEYKSLFDQYGNEFWPTEAKAKLSSLHKDITLNLKEAVEKWWYSLWVLNGPDWSILTWVFPEVINKITFNAGPKIDQAIKNIQAKINSNAARYGLTYTGKEQWVQSTAPTITANSTDDEILNDLNKNFSQ